MNADTEHIAHLADDHVHGLLAIAEADRVERHCLDCSDCLRAVEQARSRLGLLRGLPASEPSDGLVEATLEHIEQYEARRGKLSRRVVLGALVGLAASVLLLLGLHLYYARLRPTSLDLVVLGQRELLSATSASLRVRLVHRGAAMAGVPVVVTLTGQGRSHELARFTTDQQGTGSPRFEIPDWVDGRYQLEVVAQTPLGNETLSRPVQLKRAWKLMLSSDKPLYQPGQKILLRSLALRRPDLKPVAGRQAVFTLTDPRGNVLFKHTQATSKFGIASAECELAQEIQEGIYTIAVNVEGTESRLSVEVRRYVLPKFKVVLQADRPYYLPGTRVALNLQSDYFFGKPVTQGQVDLRLRTLSGQDLGTPVLGRTNAKGRFQHTLTLPRDLVGREDAEGDVRVGVAAVVTDAAGQKQVGSTELLVTTRPVRIETFPEGGQLVRGLVNTIYLLVRRADGTPLPGASVQMSGAGNATWKTDDRGAASFTILPQGEEANWTLTVRDAAGEVLARRADRLPIGKTPGDFLVRLDRATYQAGRSMKVTALGNGVEPVFLDLIKDGQTLLSQTIELKDGQGELVVDLPPELYGTLELVAYRFSAPSGLPVRKSRVVVVTPPEGLQVHTTLDREEYQPGRTATLHVRVTDDQGKPAPGAVSLWGVDEAVYSVRSQRPGMEQTFFALEEELLKPVYAIYPWRPSEGGTGLRDQVLFASTVRQMGTPPSNDVRFRMTPAIAEAGAHTLTARSLPVREEQTEMERRRGMERVRVGWVAVVMLVLLGGYIALWVYVPALEVLKIHAYVGAAVFVLGGGLLFFAIGPMGGRSNFSFVGSKMAPSAEAPTPESMAPGNKADRGPMPRVRRHFPETLLWKPELLTDDQGRLPPVQIALADSITTWRLGATAVSAEGRLGASTRPMKVFQPFFVDLNLPVSLTRKDRVGVPVVVYNHLDRPQTVALTLTKSPWFTLEGPLEQKLEIAAGEVRSTRYTLVAEEAGVHKLKVTALAGGVGDALEREIEVVPDGRKVEMAHSGGLSKPTEHVLEVPQDAIAGSVKGYLKIYPSGFSQLVEGLDSIFRMPHGCFEQTSSTTYPNVLALDYLRRNNLSVPAVEAKARQYIHLGYQRLVTFEVPGGGFDWYGRPPASPTLTAYGLMEFVDMARVHDVDPRLIERTSTWLLRQRQTDGSWPAEARGAHLAGSQDRLATTAYLAWAVFRGNDAATGLARPTLDWLLSHHPADIKDAHTLALVCNALIAIDSQNPALPAYLERLVALRRGDAQMAWWQSAAEGQTLFYGRGMAGQVETTALAVLALAHGQRNPEVTRAGLAWLVARKDPSGTWHSTQATVLALQALLAGSGLGGGEKERRVEVRLGQHIEQLVIPKDQGEVLKLVDLSKHLRPGANALTLTEPTATGASYQVVLRYHVPDANAKPAQGPLTVALKYDRTALTVGGAVRVEATVQNNQEVPAPMVMLELPVPPGFAPATEDFEALVGKGTIARFQVRPRNVLVYTRGLEAKQKFELTYRLNATMPVKVATPGARVYEYYDPRREGTSPPVQMEVRPER